MPPLLEARNLRMVFQGNALFGARSEKTAVENFTLSIRDEVPSFIAVAGESGSGKTTIARLLLGMFPPTAGAVLYRGQNIQHMPRAQRRTFRREVQAIFQDPFEVYNPFYKVDHILTTPVEKFKLATCKSEAHDLIAAALEAVGLRPSETLGRYPHQLSGGQRQRITIARALLLKPRLIIADEPVSMVDASLRATILESLHKLYREFAISFIYITHDLTTAYQVSDHLVVLYQGSVVEAGDVEQVVKNPQHPYTQELVNSIPVPDPEQRWLTGDSSQEEVDFKSEAAHSGCPYALRCPHAMPHCRERLPALYRTDERRATACYLYDEASLLGAQDLTAVFD